MRTVDRIYHLSAESVQDKCDWIRTLNGILFTEQKVRVATHNICSQCMLTSVIECEVCLCKHLLCLLDMCSNGKSIKCTTILVVVSWFYFSHQNSEITSGSCKRV